MVPGEKDVVGGGSWQGGHFCSAGENVFNSDGSLPPEGWHGGRQDCGGSATWGKSGSPGRAMGWQGVPLIPNPAALRPGVVLHGGLSLGWGQIPSKLPPPILSPLPGFWVPHIPECATHCPEPSSWGLEQRPWGVGEEGCQGGGWWSPASGEMMRDSVPLGTGQDRSTVPGEEGPSHLERSEGCCEADLGGKK